MKLYRIDRAIAILLWLVGYGCQAAGSNYLTARTSQVKLNRIVKNEVI